MTKKEADKIKWNMLYIHKQNVSEYDNNVLQPAYNKSQNWDELISMIKIEGWHDNSHKNIFNILKLELFNYELKNIIME